MLNFDFLEKGLGIVSPPHFDYDLWKKCFSCYSLFHCLIAFTSWDIEQYVYCNCLFPRLWRHKFWNYPYLSSQAVFLHDQKFKTKISILWEKKEILTWNKKPFFIIFKRLPVTKNCLRPKSAPLKFIANQLSRSKLGFLNGKTWFKMLKNFYENPYFHFYCDRPNFSLFRLLN